MNVLCRWMILMGGCLLSACADTRTQVDDFWRFVDPMGHRRSHTERYYPYERATGLKPIKGEW